MHGVSWRAAKKEAVKARAATKLQPHLGGPRGILSGRQLCAQSVQVMLGRREDHAGGEGEAPGEGGLVLGPAVPS